MTDLEFCNYYGEYSPLMTFQITNASEQNFVILEMGHPGLFFVFIYF